MTKRRTPITGSLCALVALAFLGGCIPLKKKTTVSKAELRQAENKGNWGLIRDVCNKKRKARYKVQPLACRRLKRHEAIANVDKASCSDIKRIYKKGFRERRGAFERKDPDARLKFVLAAAKRIAECKHYAFLFEHVAMDTGRNGHGFKALRWVEKSGLPIVAGWKRYLATHQGKRFFDIRSSGDKWIHAPINTSKWLVRGKHLQFCDGLVQSTRMARGKTVYLFRRYYARAKCMGAIPMMAALLGVKHQEIRRNACMTLHAIYDASIVGAVKRVAEQDPYSYIKKTKWPDGSITEKEIWPVREACSGIEKKILRRGK